MSENGVPRGSMKVITADQIRSSVKEKRVEVEYLTVNTCKGRDELANLKAPPRHIGRDDLANLKAPPRHIDPDVLANLKAPPRHIETTKPELPVPKPRRKRDVLPIPAKRVTWKSPATDVKEEDEDEDDDGGDYVSLRDSPQASEAAAKDDGCMDVDLFLLEEGKTLKGVLELSTLKHDVIDKVNLRVVCLFDVSGSMLLKCGRSRRHSKLAVLRKMAVDLVDVLEDEDDFVGLVTFGDTSKTVWPLMRINAQNRDDVKKAISNLGEVTCSETDLYSGVEHAIRLLKQDDQTSRLLYRNAIIIFSDGEINKGVTDPESLVSKVRHNIRESNVTSELVTSELKTDQWLSIACVTTGGCVSDAMYLLSKHCGNDAFYYVDSQLDHPEIDMMIPLLLRKSAIAQFVSLSVSTINGAQLEPTKCSREHTIRQRKTPLTQNKQLGYYLHDLSAGAVKHFYVEVDLAGYDKDKDNGLMSVNLEYVDAKGKVQTVSKSIKFSDRLTLVQGPDVYNKGLLENAKQEMRLISQSACRRTAFMVEQNNHDNPTLPLEEGKRKLQEISDRYCNLASRWETKFEISRFSDAIEKNLNRLTDSVLKSPRGVGHKWSKLKAVSSSIFRETPNVAHMVAESELVCPMPAVKDCVSLRTKALAMKVTCRQNVSSGLFDGYPTDLFGAVQLVAQSLSDTINKLQDLGRPELNT